MRIGILTYHQVVNDGSVVQAYCGIKALSNYFPNSSVEIIDYKSKTLQNTELKSLVKKTFPFINTGKWKKKRSMVRFSKKHLKFSPSSCVSDDLSEASSFINQLGYNIIFVGSDTVWEARFSSFSPKPPNIFYLPNIDQAKKVSFAASADPVHPEFVKNTLIRHHIAPLLSDFDFITIRDKVTEKYIENLGIESERINFLPDPTLQCDFGELVEIPEVVKEKPWAAIGYGDEEFRIRIKIQLIELGFDIVDLKSFSLNGNPIPGALNSVNIRLGVFSKLDFIISDRFHSSIFTLKLAGKPAVFVEHSSKWPLKNSKGRDLFQRLGLDEMVWRLESSIISDTAVKDFLEKWSTISVNLQINLEELKEVSYKCIAKLKENIVTEKIL